ncbi:MAG: heparinase II/III family protein [Candidatus Sumerlaeota bacterium]|nr:heparinase II/III family protein [Candidatus Sumerlaeota bacterium]
MKVRHSASIGLAMAMTAMIQISNSPAAAADAATSPSSEVRRRLAQAAPHPRLFWKAGGEEALRQKIKDDARCRLMYDTVLLAAGQTLSAPPVEYRKDGRRLLGRSREALERVMCLGMAARMTGEARYVTRAVAEMRAAAAMPNWNPSHFLDTAEMTMALATGYDWLYARLAPEDRATIREAIEKHGLGPYLKPGAKHGWEKGGNNWNQVCHAGMTAGALALLEDNPERAAEVVERALAGLPHAMKVYDPSGSYPEGPSYWGYGTTLNVVLISMLESALDTDFGLSQQPGFMLTGGYPLQMTGPTGLHFSYSDCGTKAHYLPALEWFATRAHKPEWLWFQDALLEREAAETRDSKSARGPDRFLPLALIWAAPGVKRTAPQPQDLNWINRAHNPLAVFRMSFTDPNALYLACKAGSPGASHGHMDVGSFVLDADGRRWSLDMGSQDYNKMEQRGLDIWNNRPGSDRWHIFRYHNRAHSTLMVDGQEQTVSGNAPITDYSGEPGRQFAAMDLSPVYAKQFAKATRRFSIEPGPRVVIEDHLTGGEKAAMVRWAMATSATLEPAGPGRAWLKQDGSRMLMEVSSPSPASVELKSWPANPPPADFDEPNPGIGLVGFTAPIEPGKDLILKVTLTPGSVAK